MTCTPPSSLRTPKSRASCHTASRQAPVMLLVARIMTFGNRFRASSCVRRALTARMASLGSEPPPEFLRGS